MSNVVVRLRLDKRKRNLLPVSHKCRHEEDQEVHQLAQLLDFLQRKKIKYLTVILISSDVAKLRLNHSPFLPKLLTKIYRSHLCKQRQHMLTLNFDVIIPIV